MFIISPIIIGLISFFIGNSLGLDTNQSYALSIACALYMIFFIIVLAQPFHPKKKEQSIENQFVFVPTEKSKESQFHS